MDVLMSHALEQIIQGIPVQESVWKNRAGIDLRPEDLQIPDKGGRGQFVLDIAPRLELERKGQNRDQERFLNGIDNAPGISGIRHLGQGGPEARHKMIDRF
jgi:hypothetical protein